MTQKDNNGRFTKIRKVARSIESNRIIMLAL
jgi:hypothetical protein